jgi:uncharacterized protein (DUF433 family)
MNWQERISVNPGVRREKPCIRGTRINVYDVLEYLAGGMSETKVLADLVMDALRAPPFPLRAGYQVTNKCDPNH